jgi:hypothetical protein
MYHYQRYRHSHCYHFHAWVYVCFVVRPKVNYTRREQKCQFFAGIWLLSFSLALHTAVKLESGHTRQIITFKSTLVIWKCYDNSIRF